MTKPLAVTVEVDEEVVRYKPFENGSGPMWCFGNTCIVRDGRAVFASIMENVPAAKPLNNARWALYQRTKEGWQLQQRDESRRTREPSPLGIMLNRRVLLSVNPTLTGPEATAGPAQPQVLEFSAKTPKAAYKTILPAWQGQPPFSEHSYRSFAVDGRRGEWILLQNIGYDHAEWTFRDADGKFPAQGQLVWPKGDYDEPQPIRICYPSVALVDRAVYFLGVSDIEEPNKAWRDYKRELTKQQWDYDFRRLFFTWCPDVTKRKFEPWQEIASREATCGWITPLDLYVGGDGRVHILWLERAIDERLREKFFPSAKQSVALKYAALEKGEVKVRRTLVIGGEGMEDVKAHWGRFHGTSDGRLLVLYAVSRDKKTENRLVEILLSGPGQDVPVPLQKPLTIFFTATVRGGCAPSDFIDVFGDVDNAMRYASIRVVPAR